MATTWTTESNTQATSTVSTIDTTLTLDNNKSFLIKNQSGINRFEVDNATGNTTTAGDLNVGANSTITGTLDVGSSLNLGSNSYMTLTDNEIDVSSGDLTLDVAGNIILNSDSGVMLLKDDAQINWMFSGSNMIGAISGAKIWFDTMISTNAITVFDVENDNGLKLYGDLRVVGNDILDSGSNTCITFDGSGNVTMPGNLTVTGNITVPTDLSIETSLGIGSDADGTDRTIVFGHSTLKTIMGIDDSADRFVINTDASFDSTIGDNSLSIDSNHHLYIKGNLIVQGNTVSGSAASVMTFDADDVLFSDNIKLNTDNSILSFGANDEVFFTHQHNEGIRLQASSAATNNVVNILQLKHNTSATKAAGIGTAISFETVNDDGMTLECVSTDVGSSSEDYDFVVKLMAAGNSVAEKFRVTSAGNLSCAGQFAVNGATPAAAPDYTSSSFSTNRTITGSTSAADTTDVLATLITDLIAIGILQ